MVEVEERKPVKERLGKPDNTYDNVESPKGGIGNKAKRLDFQNAERDQQENVSDEEAGARGGLSADEFRYKKDDVYDEDFA